MMDSISAFGFNTDKLQNISEEILSEKHLPLIENFKCSEEPQVEVFLKTEAYDLMLKNLVRTRLFFDENQNLIGFYSLFNENTKINPNKRLALEINLPAKVTYIPAVRLHYIGIDDAFRNQGYGGYLMMSVFFICRQIASLSGCSLITLEATKKARSFYERYNFLYLHPASNNHYDFMAIQTKGLFDE